MGTRLLQRLVPFLVLAIIGAFGVAGAYASMKSPAKTTPVCKAGQKSTKAKPCTKAKATTTTAKATTTTAAKAATTTTAAKSSGSTASSSSSSSATAGASGGDCPPGTGIPPEGDVDVDNDGGPSDGDGCI